MRTRGSIAVWNGRARLLLGLALVSGALLAPGPKLFGDDRCGGQIEPLCRTVTECWGIGSTRYCTRDFYYFPNAQ